MSRKRYIVTDISTDSKMAELAEIGGIFPLLLYTWMIPHAEDDGTITSNPAELCLKVVPGIRKITINDIKKAIEDIVSVKLMTQNNGRLQFPLDNFYKHQSNITSAKKDLILNGGTISDWNKLQRNLNKNKTALNADKPQETARRADKPQKDAVRAPSPLPSPSFKEAGHIAQDHDLDLEYKDMVTKIIGRLAGTALKKITPVEWQGYLQEYPISVLGPQIDSALEFCKNESLIPKAPYKWFKSWLGKMHTRDPDEKPPYHNLFPGSKPYDNEENNG